MKQQVQDHEILSLFRDERTKEKAFRMLVEKYQQRIYWQIRRYTTNHDDADDLLQEIFVKIWKALDQFREDSQLYTWIFRITYNQCISFLRKNNNRIHVPMDEVREDQQGIEQNIDQTTGDQIIRKLNMAIDTLPDKQKLVFNLKYFDEMKYEDMSQLLGTSVGALKASYHIAVKKIEEYLLNH